MRKRTGHTKVFNYIERVKPHFKRLCEEKKMPKEDRESFFGVFLGCNSTSYKSWYRSGIKKIYFVVLELLEEVQKHRERIKILEKQLNELTKK